jgi:Rrf2 family nitric oxide-sensitive transcriptional repressor
VNLCALHQRLDDAMAMVEKAFGDSTMADLLADNRDSRPLCETTKPVNLTINKKK